jgi:hypothetical protein
MRIALANAGVQTPHTGAPFTEAMTFGIGGSIGAGVFSFHYAKEDRSRRIFPSTQRNAIPCSGSCRPA